MTKKRLIIIFLFCIPLFLFARTSLTQMDNQVADKNLWEQTYTELEQMLNETSDLKQRGEILWRLSRLACILGDSKEKTKDKRDWYEKGINAAETGINEDANNYLCYMWHCANKGRDMQTRSLMTQASGVNVILDDLGTILNTLNHVEMSEAWQALGEVYYNHPFKSTTSAISFFRIAVDTIPEDEIRLITYKDLADALHSRNDSASKRKTEMEKQGKKWQKDNFEDNISKYENYEGKDFGASIPAWASISLAQMSDREEEKLILLYAKELYEKSINPSDTEKETYTLILETLKSIK